MAEQEIGGLRVQLSVDAQKAVQDMAAATAKMEAQAKQLETGFGRLSSAVKGVVGPIKLVQGYIAQLAGTELVRLTRAAIDSAAAVKTLSTNLGVSTDEFQELQYTAGKVEMSNDDLNKSLGEFSVRLGEARAGSGQMVDQLKDQNRALLDSVRSAPSLVAALNIAVAALSKVQDRSERAALAVDLFGKQGADLAKLANLGADGLSKMADQAHAVGAVIDGDLIEQSRAFNVELEEISRRAEKAQQSLLVKLAPALLVAARGYAQFLQGVSDAVSGKGVMEFSELAGGVENVAAQTDKATAATQRETLAGKINVERLKVELAARQKIADAQGKEIEKTELLIGATEDYNDKLIATANKSAFEDSIDAKIQKSNMLVKALDEGTISAQAFHAEMMKIADSQGTFTATTKESTDIMKEWGFTMTSALEDTIVDMVMAGDQALDLQKILRALLADLIRLAARKALTDLFNGGIGNFGNNGVNNGVQAGRNINLGPGLEIGGAADGGFISGPTLVGERGPELFIPRMPGTVVPNHELGAMGGPTIVNNFSGVSAADIPMLEAMATRVAAQQVAQGQAAQVRRERSGGRA